MYKYFIFPIIFFANFCFSQDLYTVKSSDIKFTSDAPLELIEASSDKLQGLLNIKEKSFAFRAPMKTFDGFNSALQKTHFNANYLETDKYPFTTFEGIIIEDFDFAKPGTYNIRGKGQFVCHGIEAERIIKCTLIVTPQGVNITSAFTVLLEDHDIKIPSVVHQKIAEEIVIEMKVDLIKK